jgi:hypothetical protein
MVAFTPDYKYLRMGVTPLQHTPLQFVGMDQRTTYFSKIGSVEVIYPSTIGIRKNLA